MPQIHHLWKTHGLLLTVYHRVGTFLIDVALRYMERMNEEDVKRAILVVQQSMTAFAKRSVKGVNKSIFLDRLNPLRN